MTSGERMVWAAEFVRVLATSERRDAEQAAWSAGLAVTALRRVHEHPGRIGPEPESMLADMLSTGADR